MTFRFILQPAMAIIAALRDGVHDARLGRQAIFLGLDPRRPHRGAQRTSVGGNYLDREDHHSWRRHGHHLPVEGARHILSGPGGGHRNFAGVCPLSSCCVAPSCASRVIGSPGPRPVEPRVREDDGEPRSQARCEHRTLVAPDGHVVSAHAHERRPHADVGDPHFAVADRLRLHHRAGVPEAARAGYHHEGRRAAQLRSRAWSAWAS